MLKKHYINTTLNIYKQLYMYCLNTTCPPVITTTVTGALGHTHKRFIYIHVFNRM